MAKPTHDTIGSLVRDREARYVSSQNTDISTNVQWNLKDHVENVEAYKYSKHLTGSTDSQGREKPFFNISTAASNVWYRATDIDRRNIRVKATKPEDMVAAFVATHKLQEFMRKSDFGTFLNSWGRVLADYGSAVTKFIEKDGELHPMVVPWTRLIVDNVSFDDDVVIELLELTPDKLMQRDYDKEKSKELLDALEERENSDGSDKDQKANYIKLYEVHGRMPKSYRTGNREDCEEFEQQMFVISFVKGSDGQTTEFILAQGREDLHPYMISHLIEEEGRVCAIGAYEHLFESQWIANHTAKTIKDQLDLASKLVFQTADDTYLGQNVLGSIENGDILIYKDNKPLTQLQNNSHDISALQAYGQQWDNLAKEITSTPDAIRGDTMPSGTAYRSVAIQNRESHSLFELMTENKGLAIERIMRTFVLPHIKRKMSNTDVLAATLESHDIQFIDPRFLPYRAEKLAKAAVKDILRSGDMDQLPLVTQEGFEQQVRQDLAEMGNTRFLKPSEIDSKTWKEALKDLEWELEVEVTNENTDKEATMTTLTTVLQTLAANPYVLQDKNMSMLFNKILEETGRLSPLELSQAQSTPTPQAIPQVNELQNVPAPTP